MILAAGSEVFNKLLNGGYQSGILNTIYGPASSGKTTACLLATISCAKLGKKTVFVDTENGFSVERLKQLTQEFQKVLESVTLVTVKSFKEQTRVMEKLSEISADKSIGLVVVDTLGNHFRAARNIDATSRNKAFIAQLNSLRKIYKSSECVVLVTSQVYASIDDEEEVRPIGGRMLVNKSRCMVELGVLEHNQRFAVLRKSPNFVDERLVKFAIEATDLRAI